MALELSQQFASPVLEEVDHQTLEVEGLILASRRLGPWFFFSIWTLAMLTVMKKLMRIRLSFGLYKSNPVVLIRSEEDRDVLVVPSFV